MLLEAAETALGFFGFDRNMYGDAAKKKNRKWWHTLRQDRSRVRFTDRFSFVIAVQVISMVWFSIFECHFYFY
jgi:hypothetical protein